MMHVLYNIIILNMKYTQYSLQWHKDITSTCIRIILLCRFLFQKMNGVDPSSSKNIEIRYAWRLLSDLCSDQCRPFNSLFFDRVDDQIDGLHDYYSIIVEPMWLGKSELLSMFD